MSGDVILRQRLRTLPLTLILIVAVVLFANFAVVLPSAVAKLPEGVTIAGSLLGAGLLALLVLSLRVEVVVRESDMGPNLEVHYGPGGRVRQRFTHDRLVAAQAKTMSLLALGGWGYRGSLTLLKRATLATRAGDALAVQLDGTKVFIVTVDEPQAFVDALAVGR